MACKSKHFYKNIVRLKANLKIVHQNKLHLLKSTIQQYFTEQF